MKLSPANIMMIEAFLDGELAMKDVPTIQKMMNTHSELKEVYEILKLQRNAIKCAFLSENRKH